MQGGERTQTLDESLLTDTEERDRPFVEFVGSTPGRMALIAIVLIATVLAVGVTASTTIADRRDRLETMRLHTEPLADAAQRIYGALSIANTAATTAFLSGGIEPQDVRDRYDAAIGQASAGLVTASNGVAPNDVRSLTLLTDLSNQLAVYTGMIATARANNRAGRPIGVAYLSGASALMQQAILPSAEQLYRTQADAVASSERSAGPFRAVTAASLFTLGVLVLAQAYLARRSNRRLNPGLALASVLMAVLAVWLTVAGLLSVRAATDARTKGAEPLGTAVTARILAQQARADETLGLLKRESDTQSDTNSTRGLWSCRRHSTRTGWTARPTRSAVGCARMTTSDANSPVATISVPSLSRETTTRNGPPSSSFDWTPRYATTSLGCGTGSMTGSCVPIPR